MGLLGGVVAGAIGGAWSGASDVAGVQIKLNAEKELENERAKIVAARDERVSMLARQNSQADFEMKQGPGKEIAKLLNQPVGERPTYESAGRPLEDEATPVQSGTEPVYDRSPKRAAEIAARLGYTDEAKAWSAIHNNNLTDREKVDITAQSALDVKKATPGESDSLTRLHEAHSKYYGTAQDRDDARDRTTFNRSESQNNRIIADNLMKRGDGLIDNAKDARKALSAEYTNGAPKEGPERAQYLTRLKQINGMEEQGNSLIKRGSDMLSDKPARGASSKGASGGEKPAFDSFIKGAAKETPRAPASPAASPAATSSALSPEEIETLTAHNKGPEASRALAEQRLAASRLESERAAARFRAAAQKPEESSLMRRRSLIDGNY